MDRVKRYVSENEVPLFLRAKIETEEFVNEQMPTPKGGVYIGCIKDVVYQREKAEEGFSEAQTWLGTAYRYGLYGVEKDNDEAFKWLKKAAEQKNIEAQCELGLMYYHGNGIPQNAEKAIKLWLEAIDKANADSYDYFSGIYLRLGYSYDDGDGVKKNSKEAVKWYKKSADLGELGAVAQLGIHYYEGDGVAKDEEKAKKYFTKAAEGGNAIAQYYLGCMYVENEDEMDIEKFLYWMEKAAAQKLAVAYTQLGMSYIFDLEKVTEGLELLEKAAKEDEPHAIAFLGIMYYKGEIIERNEAKGIKLLQKAAKLGIEEAQGTLEENGLSW